MGERLVSDAEVLQEILHRYGSINRRNAIAPAFEALLGVVDEVFPIELADACRAKDIMLSAQGVSARDALHLAVMERYGITRILSFDRGFDRWPGITRVGADPTA
jgi:predicted nucleic acid-binding protein